MIEITHLYDIVRSDLIDDRLQYTLEDWHKMLPGCNAQLMYQAVRVIAQHPRANTTRVLRVLKAWSPEDIAFLVAFLGGRY